MILYESQALKQALHEKNNVEIQGNLNIKNYLKNQLTKLSNENEIKFNFFLLRSAATIFCVLLISFAAPVERIEPPFAV